MRIIVVEDEATIREGICRQIEKTEPGYKVVGAAGRGGEGLALIRREKPDLVVTDVRMPEMDGITMIRLLREGGDQTKVIILSAYSEFEYAKQAIRLGVEEYLLKPINIMELKAALLRIDEQCRFEQESSDALKSLPNVCTGLIIGTLKPDGHVQRALENDYGMTENTRMAALLVYMGAEFERLRAEVIKRADAFLRQNTGIKGCALELVRDKSALLLLYGFEDEKLWKQKLAADIAAKRGSGIEQLAFGWTAFTGVSSLRPAVQSLAGLLEWSIVLQKTPFIESCELDKLHIAPCPYPIEQEARMKAALCAGDREKLAAAMKKFEEYFHGDALYSPKEVKESYIRFIWAGVSIAKDINSMQRQDMDMQRVLEAISEARTARELEGVMENVAGMLMDAGEEEKLTLTVLRVRSMISEFYNTGITLNEIAGKLDLTPEYVGTQFKKEMGVSFSSYIRQYRMDKARELLLSSSLKLYEIAAAVGYSDPKYFSRQFKETVGQLPGDYKKTH